MTRRGLEDSPPYVDGTRITETPIPSYCSGLHSYNSTTVSPWNKRGDTYLVPNTRQRTKKGELLMERGREESSTLYFPTFTVKLITTYYELETYPMSLKIR